MDFTILFRAAVAASVRRGRRTLQRLGACAKYFCKFRRQMISAPTAHFFVFHFYLLLWTKRNNPSVSAHAEPSPLQGSLIDFTTNPKFAPPHNLQLKNNGATEKSHRL